MVRSASQSLRPAPPLTRLSHEADLVNDAIDLVAGGGARRVSLVIRFGAELLPHAQIRGRENRVIVRALWHGGRAGAGPGGTDRD